MKSKGETEQTPENTEVSMEKKLILIVEDDELNREVLKSVFEEKYDFIEAENGLEGLEKLKEHKVCAVLLDMMMPIMDGISFLRKMDETDLQRNVPVFVVTADPNGPDIAEAYEMGVMDVIKKPVVPFIITKRVDSVVELFEARRKLSAEVRKKEQELLHRQQEIIELNNGMLEALFVATEFRSGETGVHVGNIRNITRILLSKSELGEGLTEEEIELISMASMMHDIGKISIPDAILNKPGRLTDDEMEIMRTHTSLGAQMLNNIQQLKNHAAYKYACDIALHHHERWDGKGYPDGLKQNEISVWAQAVSIADVYDALLCKRVYKKPFPREEAVRMILEGECGSFGPKLLEAFKLCEPEIYSEMYEHQ